MLRTSPRGRVKILPLSLPTRGNVLNIFARFKIIEIPFIIDIYTLSCDHRTSFLSFSVFLVFCIFERSGPAVVSSSRRGSHTARPSLFHHVTSALSSADVRFIYPPLRLIPTFAQSAGGFIYTASRYCRFAPRGRAAEGRPSLGLLRV